MDPTSPPSGRSHEPAPFRFWYLFGMFALAVFISMGTGYVYINRVQHQAADAQRRANEAAETQRKESLKVICEWTDSTEDFYRSLNSPAASNVADHWAKLRVILECPARKGGN